MKRLIMPLMLMLPGLAFSKGGEEEPSKPNVSETQPAENGNKAAIKRTLFAYRDALNASDAGQVLTLYTDDGVFMPSAAPTAIGQAQLAEAYRFVFSAIKLDIEFYIDEITVEGTYAFARTTSRGKTLIHASGETVPEENRELFVLQKVEGVWKISRYMFNKMQ